MIEELTQSEGVEVFKIALRLLCEYDIRGWGEFSTGELSKDLLSTPSLPGKISEFNIFFILDIVTDIVVIAADDLTSTRVEEPTMGASVEDIPVGVSTEIVTAPNLEAPAVTPEMRQPLTQSAFALLGETLFHFQPSRMYLLRS